MYSLQQLILVACLGVLMAELCFFLGNLMGVREGTIRGIKLARRMVQETFHPAA